MKRRVHALLLLVAFVASLVGACCPFVIERITSHPYDPKALLAPRDAQLGVRDAGPEHE